MKKNLILKLFLKKHKVIQVKEVALIKRLSTILSTGALLLAQLYSPLTISVMAQDEAEESSALMESQAPASESVASDEGFVGEWVAPESEPIESESIGSWVEPEAESRPEARPSQPEVVTPAPESRPGRPTFSVEEGLPDAPRPEGQGQVPIQEEASGQEAPAPAPSAPVVPGGNPSNNSLIIPDNIVPGSNARSDFNVQASGSFDPLDPLSWRQGNAPYSNEGFAFSGTNFADASCGVHTIAYLFLKSGYAKPGFTAVDAYNWAVDFGIGSNHGGMPAYDWDKLAGSTDGYLTVASTYWGEGDSHQWVRDEYNKGNFVVLGVSVNGTSHLIAVDFVDDNGDIYILDSAIQAQDIHEMDGGGVRYGYSFKAAHLEAFNSPKLWKGEKIDRIQQALEAQPLPDVIPNPNAQISESAKEERQAAILELYKEYRVNISMNGDGNLAGQNEEIRQHLNQFADDAVFMTTFKKMIEENALSSSNDENRAQELNELEEALKEYDDGFRVLEEDE